MTRSLSPQRVARSGRRCGILSDMVEMTQPAPVMTDVARLAGVSHQTVSRVVNGSPHVSEHTRPRVLAAMEELGSRRNAAARALATRRSGTLGVITLET